MENESNNTNNDLIQEYESNTMQNETTENVVVEDTNTVTLVTIHHDLGFICTFLVIASVLIFIRIIYKLFNMFF